MTKMIKVSVVTISYNEGTRLESTVESVALQTYQKVEYIVIDGGSNDGSIDIINKYNYGIDHYSSEPDQGKYDAMNKGLNIASGDWIIFMNAGDTFLDKNTLSEAVSNFSNMENIYFGRANIMSLNNESWLYPAKFIDTSNIHKWLKKNLPNHQATFFPKSFYKFNLYDTSLDISADSKYKEQALKDCPYTFLNMTVCNFFIGGVSSSPSIKNMVINCNNRYARGKSSIDYLNCISKSVIKWLLNVFFGHHSHRFITNLKNYFARIL